VLPDHEGAADRVLDIPERPRAQARQSHWRWPGAVELVHDMYTVTVPGTWAVESGPAEQRAADCLTADAEAFPSIAADSAAWAHRLRRVLTLQEPGTRVSVGAADAHDWQALHVTVPTRPPTLIHIDRNAMAQLVGPTVSVHFRIEA
jgi:hypothetical protein